jgi:hypothetical protein
LVTSNVWDSNRNRSGNSVNTGAKVDPQMLAAEKNVINDPKLAMSALEAGQLMLRGMRRNDLYILTHPEFAQVIRARNAALLAAIPTDLHPSAERVAYGRSVAESSIYVSERDHDLCAKAARARQGT